MKISNRVWIPAAAVLVAGVVVGAYFVGRSSHKGVSAGDLSELESLRSSQSEAAVVKRVSQQMENIAYQQKAVSDLERDRAEQQSAIALKMRDRAEQESRAARSAETKAREAAAEAQTQRARALEHQEMAEQQAQAANYAKSVADTLSYRALGRTLGSSSTAQFENGADSLAGALAYASWYFLKNYSGDTYSPECFKALSESSMTTATLATHKGGAVMALYPLEGIGCVIATDYGEIEIARKNGGKSAVVVQDSKYDFRSLWADNSTVYALSLHGPLCKISAGKELQEITLPQDSYFRLIRMENGNFLIAGKNRLLLLDAVTQTVTREKTFEVNMSEIVYSEGEMLLFFEDGSALDGNLNFKFKPYLPKGDDFVTAVYFDLVRNMYFLGCNSGHIYLVDEQLNQFSILGHTSRVTQIAPVGNVLVSSSYDKNLYIWNMDKGNWLTPACVTYDGWPLSLCRFTDSEIAVGTSRGEVNRLNVSTDSMAGALKDAGKVSMSRDAWKVYVGETVPYIDFAL